MMVPEDDHRASGVRNAGLADRSEQHPGELTMPAATDDEEVSPAGSLYEHGGRMPLEHAESYVNVRVSLPNLRGGVGGELLRVGCRVILGGQRERPSVAGRPLP